MVGRPKIAPTVDFSEPLRPNSDLDEDQRKTIIRDYGMTGGKLQVKVRAAMKEYFLAHWRVPGPGRPAHLALE